LAAGDVVTGGAYSCAADADLSPATTFGWDRRFIARHWTPGRSAGHPLKVWRLPLWGDVMVRHEALFDRAVMKGHRRWFVAADRLKLTAAW